MKYLVVLALFLSVAGKCQAGGMADYTGVIRIYGEMSSWMSTCFVAGDGKHVITTADSVLEHFSEDEEKLAVRPVFISSYSAKAYPGKVVSVNKKLNIAVIEIDCEGLPAVSFGDKSDFSGAAFGTMGELMKGEPIGNNWPTEIYGVAKVKKKNGKNAFETCSWDADKIFVTDIGEYRWLFLSDIGPQEPTVPNGAIVAKNGLLLGMYLNKLVFTGPGEDVVFARAAMATEMAEYLAKKGIDVDNPLAKTDAGEKKYEGAQDLFDTQIRTYAYVALGRNDLVLESAKNIVKLISKDRNARLLLVSALISKQEMEEAQKELEEAEKLSAEGPDIILHKASIAHSEDEDKALALLQEGHKKYPSDERFSAALADYYIAKNDTKAVEWAKKRTETDPESPLGYMQLADAYMTAKEYQNSINSIGEALKIAPEWTGGWTAMGAVFETAGDMKNAEKCYLKAHEINSNDLQAILTLASFYADTGKKQKALDLVTEGRELKPPAPILAELDKVEEKANNTYTENDKDDNIEVKTDTGS